MKNFVVFDGSREKIAISARDVVKVTDDGWERHIFTDDGIHNVYNTTTTMEDILAQLED